MTRIRMHRLNKVLSQQVCACGCGEFTWLATENNSVAAHVKGQPIRFLNGHQNRGRHRIPKPRLTMTKWYRTVGDTRPGKDGGYLHRHRAEQALGKPLPPKAVVHHADGTKADHAVLVICQDQAYHFLLHRRMRVREMGGNPNTDAYCSQCRQVKAATEFYLRPKGYPREACKACALAAFARLRQQRGAA